jgi:hypothetical protein
MPPTNRKGTTHAAMIDVPLDCGHVVHYKGMPPRKDDTVYCGKCGDYADVKSDIPNPYRLICNGCGYNRPYGTEKIVPLRKANLHLVKFPSHTLTLWLGSDEIETLRNDNVSLFLVAELRKANQAHQSGLKNLGKLGDESIVEVQEAS